jgi:hypothetical protein
MTVPCSQSVEYLITRRNVLQQYLNGMFCFVGGEGFVVLFAKLRAIVLGTFPVPALRVQRS